MILSSSGPALSHAAFTASHICNAKSGSVWVKVSGLYSYMNLVPCAAVHSSVNCFTSLVCFTASSMVCSFELRNTTSRKVGDVALYICRIAFFVPATASIVRLIKSSRAGVKTYFDVSTITMVSTQNNNWPATKRRRELRCSR